VTDSCKKEHWEISRPGDCLRVLPDPKSTIAAEWSNETKEYLISPFLILMSLVESLPSHFLLSTLTVARPDTQTR